MFKKILKISLGEGFSVIFFGVQKHNVKKKKKNFFSAFFLLFSWQNASQFLNFLNDTNEPIELWKRVQS